MKKHLLKIINVIHWSKDGKIIWKQENVKNTLHAQGEFYVLSALFNAGDTSIPADYFAGLDARTTPTVTDTLSNLSQEPTQNGYARQSLSSSSGFVISETSNVYVATSNVMTFSASGGTWGPITNLFLATTLDNSGYLISTAVLDGSHTVGDGESLTLQLALSLTDLGVG